MPIIIAAAIWDPHWQGCHVCLHSDNMAMVSVLDKKATRGVRMAQLLHTLFSMQPSLNFTFHPSTY